MRLILALILGAVPASLIAHGGGLDRNGCHNDRKRGGYHCHRGSYEPPAPQPIRKAEKPVRNDQPQTLFGGGGSGIQYSADVETAQKLLAELGYNPGEPDGLLGEKTRSAVRAFERDQGFPESGIVSQQLISQLIDALAQK